MSFAAVAVASFLPDVRLWGINHLAFYSLPVRAAALVLIGLTFIPRVAETAYSGYARLISWIEGQPALSFRTLVLVAGIAATFLFFFFRSATNLLGDGQLIAQSFEAAAMGHEKVIMRSTGAIVTEERIAPGVTLVYFVAARWAVDVFGAGPVIGIRAANCVLGGVYVALLLALVRRALLTSDQKRWLLVMGLFGAFVELYFGYVENYTPLLLFLFLYVVSGFLFIHRRVGFVWPILLFAAAAYMHVQAWVFGPSLVFLLIWRSARGKRRWVVRRVPPILMLLTLVGVVLGYFTTARRYLLPLYEPGTYSVLSPAHFGDVANQMLLVLPILPVVLAMAWLGRVESPEQAKKLPRDLWLAHPEEWQFLALTLVPNLLYLFAFNPEIGMARDWDLFGMLGVVTVPWTLLVLGRYVRTSAVGPEEVARFAAPALVLSVVMGIAWFGINASKWRTADRFESILQYDNAHGSYAWENLAIFYQDNGRLERATTIMENTYTRWRNPRHAVRLAMYYERTGKSREAEQLMYDVIERHPRDDRSRMKLIMTLEATGQWDEILPVARDGTRYHPDKAGYYFYLGESLIRAGDIEGGVAAFKRCLQLDPRLKARAYMEKWIADYESGAVGQAPRSNGDGQ